MMKFLIGAFVAACGLTSSAFAVDASTNTVYDAVNAAPHAGKCFGTAGTADACVDTSQVYVWGYTPIYQDCVYAGGSTCSSFTVSAPKIHREGAVTVECGITGGSCVP